jgi:uncharacterized protein
METYKATARRRWQREQRQRVEREERAWCLARQAVHLLRDEYQVSDARLFGSLLHPGRFTLHSDIDLAAWGLTADNWLKASATVRALSDDIEINLVDVTACSPFLREAIEREGVSLL